MIQLPRELVARVIDLLHDDPEALRSSCLVHPWWISPCRRHLFSSANFHELFDLELWADSFPSALHSPAKNVRNLSIAGLWASLGDEEFNPDELEGPLLEHFRSFDLVQKLTLTALNLNVVPSPELHFSHLRSSLTSLELYSPYPTTPTKLLEFISSFPRLQNLLIAGIGNWREEQEVGCFPRLETSPPLRGSLKLVDSHDPGGRFISGLVDLPNGVSFCSITVDLISEDYRAVGRLVKYCATPLETLQIGGSFSAMPNDGGEMVDLSSNLNLHQLEFTIEAVKVFSCAMVEGSLASMASPRSTAVTVRISFALPFTSASQFKSNDWSLLDAILASNIDRGVKINVFVDLLYGSDSPVWGGVVSLVESVLPMLSARGLVSADFTKASQRRYYGSGLY